MQENTPRRFIATCERCGITIDTREPGHGQRVECLAVTRVQGGSNANVMPKRLNRWVCKVCISLMRRKGRAEQPAML